MVSRMRRVIMTAVLSVAGVLLMAPDVAANVNNFTITDYDVQMRLERDDQQRSVLRTTETIIADFPLNQNQGLERVFVKTYQDRSTSFDLESVTDGSGTDRNYHWNGDALRIGDQGTYVSGSQTYQITYTQRDVTRNYQDTGRDEFYWDAIGTDWRVPIQSITLRLRIDPALSDAVETDLLCYQGQRGSTSTCDVARDEDGVYVAQLDQLQPSQGVTTVIGFADGTFAEYQPSMWARLITIWIIVQAVLALAAIGLLIYVFTRQHRMLNRTRELQTVVTEYLPPRDVSLTAAASLSPMHSRSVKAAQLLDLAVRHYIKLYQVREAKLFRAAEYEIEVVKPIDDLAWEERELLNDKFGHQPQPGDRLNLKKLQNNTAYQRRLQNNDSDLQRRVRGEYDLRAQDPQVRRWLRRVALWALIIGVLLLSPPMLIASVVVFVASFYNWRLTDRGLAVRRHMDGLRHYISVAESERLQLLQSPEGAERVATVTDGADTAAQRIVLYERVLPYAVLFGQEKQWNQHLGKYYEQTQSQPDWYSGSGANAFNAVALGSAVNGFSSAVALASASSDSSGSGGSSGGGSVGGGGGGGGGGGW